MVDLAGFKIFLLTGDRRITSVISYIVVLKTFANHFESLTLDTARQYISLLVEKKRKSTYINRFVDVAHMYGDFIQDNSLKELKCLKEQKAYKSVMSDDEIIDFLTLEPTVITRTYASGKVVTRYQHEKLFRKMTIFWKICSFTGCRMGECSHLSKQDIYLGDKAIRFDGKTGERVVPIPPNIFDDVNEYVNNLDGEFLFPSARGGNSREHGEFIDAQDWGFSFRSRIKRLGIQRRGLTPYSLRHSYVSATLDGNNLFDAMTLYGHKDPKTTLGYYHTGLDKLRKVMTKHKLIRMQTNPIEVFKDIVEALKSFHLDDDGRFSYSLKEENKKLLFELEISDT